MQVSDDNFYVYIVANQLKTAIYTGMTNALLQRVVEHYLNRGMKPSLILRQFKKRFLNVKFKLL